MYLGGRDQEDHGLKPARANRSQILITKKDWWSGSSHRVPTYQTRGLQYTTTTKNKTKQKPKRAYGDVFARYNLRFKFRM
jgi:hypothetical protein